MPYKILADVVVFVHFLWIIFLISGAFLGARYKAVKVIHISGLIFAFSIQIFDRHCPLTHLEVWFRSKHDPSLSYTGSFLIHYVEKIIYIGLPQYVIAMLTVFLCVFNGWVYLRKRA
ncbi:MAG: DUF2784 domain-containing protein [Nitrospirae bacterium]|nr:DUF2784 domain-containing protein [Nitrospirota bacterium]